eukprot:6480794-Amphidinium_carterae.1
MWGSVAYKSEDDNCSLSDDDQPQVAAWGDVAFADPDASSSAVANWGSISFVDSAAATESPVAAIEYDTPVPAQTSDVVISAARRGRKKQILSELAAAGASMLPEKSAHHVDPRCSQPEVFVAGPCVRSVHTSGSVLACSSMPCHVPEVSSYMPVVHGGFNAAPILSSALQIAVQKATSESVDEDYDKLQCHYLLTADGAIVASLTVLAASLKIPQRTLQKKLQRLVCAQLVLGKTCRVLLEQLLFQRLAPNALLAYFDYQAYDETPMKASMTVRSNPISEDFAADSADFGLTGLSAMCLDAPWKDPGIRCKFLQCQEKFAMVVQPQLSVLTIIGEMPVPLQVLERTTGECIMKALVRNSSVSSFSSFFKTKVRGSCSDKASANARAEELLMAGRTEKWYGHRFVCDVHVCSTCMKKSVHEVLPSQVSGLLHLALSLRDASALSTFKRALRQVITSRLQILRGSPPATATHFKKLAMETFLTESSSSLVQQVMLERLPNGDWSNRSSVEFYCGVGSSMSAKKIVEMYVGGLCAALLSHKPRLFPQHRWSGAEVAIDDISKLEIIHGLLSACYPVFLALLSNPSLSLSAAQGAVSSELQDGLAASEAELVAESTEGGALPAFQPQQEANRSPQQHSHDRQVASEWLNSSPLSFLVALRLAVQPLTALMYRQFQTCSAQWELGQRAHLVTQLNAATSTETPTPHRQYMVTIAATGTLEQKCLEDIMNLFFNCPHWQLVSDSHLHVWFNAKLFCLLTREACCVKQLLSHEHSRFPCRLYALLETPALYEQMLALPHCILDEWSFQMLHGQGYTLHQLLHILEGQAMVQSTNIASLESKHAANRRILTRRAVQTWAVPVETVSAEHVARCMRQNIMSLLAKVERTTSGGHADKTKVLPTLQTLSPHWYQFWVVLEVQDLDISSLPPHSNLSYQYRVYPLIQSCLSFSFWTDFLMLKWLALTSTHTKIALGVLS